MQVNSSANSDVGRQRSHNEDSYYVDDEVGLYAVADGVGGAAAGEMASRLFCEVLSEYRDAFRRGLERSGSDPEVRQELLGLMERVFQRASERIYRLADREPRYRGMATTAVVLALGPRGGVLGHVGDSRAYLFQSGRTQRLTVDHTLAQEMLSQGLISAEELATFPHRNVLARAVGQLPTVRVDTAWLELTGDETLLICSDGLHGYFEDDAELLTELRGGVDGLIEQANDRGGQDNITAVILELEPDEDEATTRAMLDTRAKVACISDMFLFKYLDDQEMVRVLKIVYERHCSPGEVIFEEGAPGDSFYLVFSGSVDVKKGPHRLTTIGQGGHFGELAFMDGHPRSAAIVAREPTTLLTIKRDDFRALTRTEPTIANKLLWCLVLNMAGRLRDLSQSYVKVKRGQ